MSIRPVGPYRPPEEVLKIHEVLQKYAGEDKCVTLQNAIKSNDLESVEILCGLYVYEASSDITDTALEFGNLEMLTLLQEKGLLSPLDEQACFRCNRIEEPGHLFAMGNIDFRYRSVRQRIYEAEINRDSLVFLRNQNCLVTWEGIIIERDDEYADMYHVCILNSEDLKWIELLNLENPSLNLTKWLMASYSHVTEEFRLALREMLLFLIPLLPKEECEKWGTEGRSPLESALSHRDEPLLKVLLEAGVPVDDKITTKASAIDDETITQLVLSYIPPVSQKKTPIVQEEAPPPPSLRERVQQAVPVELIKKTAPIVAAFLLGQMFRWPSN